MRLTGSGPPPLGIELAPRWIDVAPRWIDVAPRWIEVAPTPIGPPPLGIALSPPWIDAPLGRILGALRPLSRSPFGVYPLGS